MSSVFEAQGYSIDINAVKDQLRLLGHEVSDDVILNFIKDVYLPQRIAQAQQPRTSPQASTLYNASNVHASQDPQSEHSTRSSHSTCSKLQHPTADNLALADAIETDDNVVLSEEDEFDVPDDTDQSDSGSPKFATPGQRASSSKHTPIELRGDSASDWNDDFGLGALKISAQSKLLNQQRLHTDILQDPRSINMNRHDSGAKDTPAPQHTSHTILPDTATARDCHPSMDSTQNAAPYSPSASTVHGAAHVTHSVTSATNPLSNTGSLFTHHHNTYASINPSHHPARPATQLTTSKAGTPITSAHLTNTGKPNPPARCPVSSHLPEHRSKPPAAATAHSSPFLAGHPSLPQHRTRPTYAPAAPEPEPSLSNYSVRSTSSRASTMTSASGGSGKKKVDRVSRYHQLAAGWEKDRFLKRNEGRPKQAINFHTYFASVHAVENERQQQRKQAVRAQTKKALEPASSYQVPTEKRRDSLRWEVRTHMRRVADA